MTESATPAPRRTVTLTRTETGRYIATNKRGLELPFGHGDDLFSPVELLLAAIGGCSAIDVDYITVKRAEPTSFTVSIDAGALVDANGGHRLSDVAVDFQVAFPDTAEGQAAASVVERSVAQSRDRLCTVSRTVAAQTPVEFRVDGTVID